MSEDYCRSSFLEHPLCKELGIGSLDEAALCISSTKRRSLERRCAMDLSTPLLDIDPPPCKEIRPPTDFQTRKSTCSFSREYAKNDPFNNTKQRHSRRTPLFRRISTSVMDGAEDHRAISCQLEQRNSASSWLSSRKSVLSHSPSKRVRPIQELLSSISTLPAFLPRQSGVAHFDDANIIASSNTLPSHSSSFHTDEVLLPPAASVHSEKNKIPETSTVAPTRPANVNDTRYHDDTDSSKRRGLGKAKPFLIFSTCRYNKYSSTRQEIF